MSEPASSRNLSPEFQDKIIRTSEQGRRLALQRWHKTGQAFDAGMIEALDARDAPAAIARMVSILVRAAFVDGASVDDMRKVLATLVEKSGRSVHAGMLAQAASAGDLQPIVVIGDKVLMHWSNADAAQSGSTHEQAQADGDTPLIISLPSDGTLAAGSESAGSQPPAERASERDE